jgi:hypothetical protein
MAAFGAVANLPECLTSYRVHPGSLTSRQPVRMAITSICVSTGARARQEGKPEPFIGGVPSLRAALCQQGLTRESVRRMVRVRIIRHRLARASVMLPVPGRLKALARAAVTRLGPRHVYLGILDLLFGTAGRKRLPSEARM